MTITEIHAKHTFAANCYVVRSEKNNAFVVDPGAEGENIIGFMKEHGITPRMILLTHGHFDHVGAVKDLQAAWPGLRCPVAVALSEDGGQTFPLIRYLELGEGYMGEENRTNNRQYEYPFLMQSADGMLHLAYAAYTRAGVKYLRFSEQDVTGAKRERVGLYNPTAAQSR